MASPLHRTRGRSHPLSLRFESLEPRTLLAAELLGLGHGLAANYFSDSSFTNLVAARVDPQVNFNWGVAPSLASLPADGFSVRWTGKFQAPYSETYTFYVTTAADDGLRLTITTVDLSASNGRKPNTLIDTWVSHTAAETSGSIALAAGETYDLTIEYTNHSDAANVALSYGSPSTAKTIIPSTQLYPTPSLAVSSIGGSWLTADVGSPPIPGSFLSQGPRYVISGSGNGISETTDQFQYAYKVLQGDGVAMVRVDGFHGSATSDSQVGLVVRDGTASGAVYAGIFMSPGGNVTFSYRGTVSQPAVVTTPSLSGLPAWLKLVRRGPTVNTYVSSSGADDSWTFVGRADIRDLNDAVLLGVAATSNSLSQTAEARLSNVSVVADTPFQGGLGYLATYQRNLPLIDLVIAGCGPAMRLDAGGSISNTAATVDPAGWPAEDFGFRGPYLQQADAIVGRPFTLTFTGSARVSITAPGSGVATPASETTGDVGYIDGYNEAGNSSKWYLVTLDNSGGNGTGISPRFQNTKRTADSASGTGVTDVHLLQPGYTSYDLQHVFTSEWLTLVKPIGELRVKDWAGVDNTPITSWDERTRPATPNQLNGKGLAWEFVVQFCNTTHKDMWLSIPAHADATYILKLAQLLRYGSDGAEPYTNLQANPVFPGLDPDLNIYVEYANENWNGAAFESNRYSQTQAWAAYQAGARFGPNQVTLNYDGRAWTSPANQDLIYRWIAAHMAQDVIQSWKQVFGDEALNTRFRPVISAWTVAPDRTVEESLKFLAAAGWAPKDTLYAASAAGYYGDQDLAEARATTNAARDSATTQDALARYAAVATLDRGALMWPINTAIAAAYGLKQVAYEGGPSLGVTNAQAAAQLDPTFASMTRSVINSWFASGAGQYNFSFLFFQYAYGSQYGDYNLGNNPWDMNQPRTRAFWDLATADSTPPVIDGFTALPSGEMEGRNYSVNATPGPMYTVAPADWESTHTYRYIVRSLVGQDVDLRLSVAARAAADRVQILVNGTSLTTVDYATASGRDPAGNFLYTDTAPRTIHLNPGLNLIDVVVSNPNDTMTTQNAKAAINSLKFTPVGGSLGNSLPWAWNLPGNSLNLNVAQLLSENGSSAFGVDVQDRETPAVANQPSPFTLSATSDNAAVLPNDSTHIQWSYDAATTRWMLRLTPTTNMTGKTNLTVAINDPQGGRRIYVIPLSVVPAQPTAVTATAVAGNSVTVAWTNNSRVNPTFKIERSASFTGAAWSHVGLTSAMPYGSSSWTDTPPAGQSYYYRITAIDPNGVAGNFVVANANASVFVNSGNGGIGAGVTNLFNGKTWFASSTDTTANGGGQSVASAFDGTSQYFAFSATTGNSLAATRIYAPFGIDTLKFSFPGNANGMRMPPVSIYYSASDYSAQPASYALHTGNYIRLGASSYTLYQTGVAPVTTQPDGLQVATLSGLAIPSGTQSVLLVFDSSQAAPQLAEIQAFAGIGTIAPTGLTVSTGWIQFDPKSFANYVGATVSLSWTNPNSAPTSFVVQRDTNSNFASYYLRTWNTALNATSFLNDRDNQDRAINPYAPFWDTAHNALLPPGTTYYYRVGTRQADGTVVYGSPVTVATPAATYPIAAPAGLTATAVSDYRINLCWNAVPGATGYKIEKSTRSDFRDMNYALGQVTTTSYVDPTLSPNGVWYYRVRAIGANGDSAWSTIQATAGAITDAPGRLTAIADRSTIRLTWDRPMGTLYAYEIYRGLSSANLTLYKSFQPGGNAVIWPEFVDTCLPDGATYYYAVRAAYWTNNTNPSQIVYTAQSEFTSATTLVDQAPHIVNWASARTHGTAGEVALAIGDDGRFSEPRNGGTSRLLIRFDAPVSPASLTPSSVQIAGNRINGSSVDLSSIVVATSLRNGNTVGVIDFANPLPDQARYLVRLQGIRDLFTGAALRGDNDRIFTALKGDVSGDLRVNATDLSRIMSALGESLDTTNTAQIRADVNLDGRVNASDLSAAWAYRNADARFIASPSILSPAVSVSAAGIDWYFSTAAATNKNWLLPLATIGPMLPKYLR